jgi:hypothetical protein
MNESTLTNLKVLVERAVRPVQAGLRRKQQMREELLAHVVAVYEEEAPAHHDEPAALARTGERFGDPTELSGQLQAAVPGTDALDRFVDRIWFRPGESTRRRAVRHGLLLDGVVLAFLALIVAVGMALGSWPVPEMFNYAISVLVAMFWFAVGFTYLADWMRQTVYEPTARPGLKALFITAVSSLLVPVLGYGLWPDFAQLPVQEVLVVAALGLVVPAILIHLAKVTAARVRDHREWANLPMDGVEA